MRSTPGIVIAIACALFGATCKRTASEEHADATVTAAVVPTRGIVRISGSSALLPLLNVAKESFEEAHSGMSVEVSAGGSQKGLADVASGAVEIGASDIEAPEALRGALVDHRIAVVGIAAVAHKGSYNAGIGGLTLSELSGIFTGKITDWKELGGDARRIVVINRPSGSGTRAVFVRVVLGEDAFAESRTEDNSGALVWKLEQTEGAISYVALPYARDSLRSFAIRTGARMTDPTAANIAAGAYPLWSYEHLYTRGEPKGAARLFLSHVEGGEFQRRIATLRGFVPITAMTVVSDPPKAGGTNLQVAP